MQILTKEKAMKLIDDAPTWEKGICDTFTHHGYTITLRKQDNPLFLYSAEASSNTERYVQHNDSIMHILMWIMNDFQHTGKYSTISDVLANLLDTSHLTDAEKIVKLIYAQLEAEVTMYKAYKMENPTDKERDKIHSSIVGEYIKLLHSIRAMGIKTE